MRFKERERDDPRINITPLVDILFLLIIFFTVTTTFATTGGIDVDLPESRSQSQVENVQKLFVTIDRKGDAFIEGERMSGAELKERFQKLSKERENALVIIQADRSTAHGRVVTIMDLARAEGLKRLAIATQRQPETSSAMEEEK